jgi:hypothetical protein
VPEQDGSPEDSYDPMRQFAELAGDVRDPYPMFAGIRADSPVTEAHFGPEPDGTSRLDQKAPPTTSLFTLRPVSSGVAQALAPTEQIWHNFVQC